MKHSQEIFLETDHDAAIAEVFCSRCKESIGRVAVQPDESGEEAEEEWRMKVEGELSVIASEHRALCHGGLGT